jgi:hypothetical protein
MKNDNNTLDTKTKIVKRKANPKNANTGYHRVDPQLIDVWFGDLFYYKKPEGAFKAAELIVDAFNTAKESGLLPSQLLKQRDEMAKVIRQFHDLTKDVTIGPLKTPLYKGFNKTYLKAEKLLSSIEHEK